MIRRSTVVYIVLLLILAGAYYYFNNREKPADIELTVEPVAEVSYLFTAEEGTPTSIRVESKTGETVEVVLGADNVWTLTRPIEATADQAAVGAAASQISTIRILDTVPKDVEPSIVRLENPEYVLSIKFISGVERTLDVGIPTPSESGFYVRDHGSADAIVIVSRGAIDSLLGLLQNPPYLETPTPSPIPPTETLTPLPPTPEAETPSSETATP